MAKNENPKKNDFFNKILNDYLNETKKANLNSNYFHESNYYYDVLDHLTSTSTMMNKTMDKFLGDPYELLNKNITADEIGQWINEVEAIRNNGKSLMESLKDPSKDFTKHQYGVNVDKDFFDMVKDSFNELGEEKLSLYRQQEQALRNRQKYENKDIMNEIEAQKLIEESNRIQDSIPKRGDQFYDPKRKRQYVYEGPDDVFEGKHSFISDQGRTFVGDFSDLEKFTDESRFLDIDEMVGYRNAIDNMDQYLGNVHHGGHSLKNEFWEEAQKAVKEVEAYENKVKKRIKHHRMETGVNNNRKVLKNYINDWKNKHNNTNANTNQNQNTNRNRNTNTNTNRNSDAYEQARRNMGSGDTVDLNTGDIKKADGTIIKKDGTIIPPPDTNANTTVNPDVEDMDGGPDWDGGANDFDQGAYYEENIPETDWFDGHDGADDMPFGAEDFDDEFLANLTDDQILEQAQTNEELERYIKMRDDARARLGMDNQTFNTETGSETINNNFNGVNQERQQQGRNNQQQQRGNQEHKIDTDKPWTWTDDDIRIMADGDPDAAIELMNQREQARQQQQQNQNQQRQTQEETKNTAEETTGDTSGSSNKETPKGNIDEETLKKRKIERQQRSDRVRHANRKLKGKTGKQLKNRSKGALRRGRAKGKYTGKKFRVKGGNLKQAVANTIVNEVVHEVAEETVENILHPNMFNSLDQFADMSDDDIQHFADMIENEDLRKQRTKEWKDKRKQARNERKKQQKIDKQEKMEETINDLHEQYVNGEYKQEIPMHEKAKMNQIEFEVDENGRTVIKKNKLLGGSADGDDIFGWMKKHNIGLAEAINVISTIGTYKDARKQGKSVVSSIASAAGTFVKGELLGFWGSLGWELAKGVPKLAIKGAETLYKENRKMNAAANQQVFGGAQFQDTQQLATMRQSGMEMAKMAQYNLQQTLMGAEATHLHR